MTLGPLSPYAVAKLAGELHMRVFHAVYGRETVTLRYFNVIGPYQDPMSHDSGVLAIFCQKMLAGEDRTIHGDGEQCRDFTYIDNVVWANLLAADAAAKKVAGQMMNVAAGSAISLNERFAILREPGRCWATGRRCVPRGAAADGGVASRDGSLDPFAARTADPLHLKIRFISKDLAFLAIVPAWI